MAPWDGDACRYDGEFWSNKDTLMQLYDVGMTSMFTMEAAALAVRPLIFAVPYPMKNGRFCQDRLGTRTIKQRVCRIHFKHLRAFVLWSAGASRRDRPTRRAYAPVQNTPLLSRFHFKTIILPRQARDKHGESTQKRYACCAGSAPRRCGR